MRRVVVDCTAPSDIDSSVTYVTHVVIFPIGPHVQLKAVIYAKLVIYQAMQPLLKTLRTELAVKELLTFNTIMLMPLNRM